MHSCVSKWLLANIFVVSATKTSALILFVSRRIFANIFVVSANKTLARIISPKIHKNDSRWLNGFTSQ